MTTIAQAIQAAAQSTNERAPRLFLGTVTAVSGRVASVALSPGGAVAAGVRVPMHVSGLAVGQSVAVLESHHLTLIIGRLT